MNRRVTTGVIRRSHTAWNIWAHVWQDGVLRVRLNRWQVWL